MQYKAVSDFLQKQKDIKPPIQEEEALFFIYTKLTSQSQSGIFLVGEYVFKKTDVDGLMTWLDSQKGKKQTEIKKWLSLLMLGAAKVSTSYDLFFKLSKICKIDIGKNIQPSDLKNSAFWVKDLDLGKIQQVTPCCGFHHHHHYDSDNSDSNSDSEDYSSSDF